MFAIGTALSFVRIALSRTKKTKREVLRVNNLSYHFHSVNDFEFGYLRRYMEDLFFVVDPCEPVPIAPPIVIFSIDDHINAKML